MASASATPVRGVVRARTPRQRPRLARADGIRPTGPSRPKGGCCSSAVVSYCDHRESALVPVRPRRPREGQPGAGAGGIRARDSETGPMRPAGRAGSGARRPPTETTRGGGPNVGLPPAIRPAPYRTSGKGERGERRWCAPLRRYQHRQAEPAGEQPCREGHHRPGQGRRRSALPRQRDAARAGKGCDRSFARMPFARTSSRRSASECS